MFPVGQTTVDPIDVAMSIVRDFCGWHITPVLIETIVLDGNGARYLHLPSKHVLNVTAVTEDGHPVTVSWSQSGVMRKTAGDVTAYPLTVEGWSYPDGHGHWTSNDRAIQLTIEHGYEAAEVASVLGVVRAVASRIQLNPSGVMIHQRAGTQGYNLLPGGVPLLATEKLALQRYRLET